MSKKIKDPALQAMKREITHIVNDVDPYMLRPHDHYGEEGATIAILLHRCTQKNVPIRTRTVDKVVSAVWKQCGSGKMQSRHQRVIVSRVCELLPRFGIELAN